MIKKEDRHFTKSNSSTVHFSVEVCGIWSYGMGQFWSTVLLIGCFWQIVIESSSHILLHKCLSNTTRWKHRFKTESLHSVCFACTFLPCVLNCTELTHKTRKVCLSMLLKKCCIHKDVADPLTLWFTRDISLATSYFQSINEKYCLKDLAQNMTSYTFHLLSTPLKRMSLKRLFSTSFPSFSCGLVEVVEFIIPVTIQIRFSALFSLLKT